MKINRALGLGLVLLLLQWLTASMWGAFEHTVITAFDVTDTALATAKQGLETMPALTPPSVPLPK